MQCSRRGSRASSIALLAVMLAIGSGGALAVAAEPATLRGRLLDPQGNSAAGLVVVARDMATRREYLSGVSTLDGSYEIDVPPGGRYRVVAALTPEGERLPIRLREPVDVRRPGVYPLPDVRFVLRDDEAAAAATDGPEGRPWYRQAGGVIGLAAGGVAVLVFAFDDEEEASPSSP